MPFLFHLLWNQHLILLFKWLGFCYVENGILIYVYSVYRPPQKLHFKISLTSSCSLVWPARTRQSTSYESTETFLPKTKSQRNKFTLKLNLTWPARYFQLLSLFMFSPFTFMGRKRIFQESHKNAEILSLSDWEDSGPSLRCGLWKEAVVWVVGSDMLCL